MIPVLVCFPGLFWLDQALSGQEEKALARIGKGGFCTNNADKLYSFDFGWGVAVTGDAFACAERSEMTVVNDFGI